MSPAPVIDGRDDDDFHRAALERAPHYVPEWDASSDDVGAALLRLYAELAGDVAERVDRLPEKHHVAFVDTLGFERTPPTPARLPVSVTVTPAATANVPIPAGTRVVATGLDGGERTFEVREGDAFEATPARLRTVLGVDPSVDAVYDHGHVVAGTAATDHATSVFGGESRQEHALYLANDDLLTVTPGSFLRVVLDTNSPVGLFRDCLQWEYHGVETTPDGEEDEGWHPLVVETTYTPDCQYSTRTAASVLANLVVDRRPDFVVGTPTTAPAGADRPLVAVGAALREWFADPDRHGDEAVLDALLPADATTADREAAREALGALEDEITLPGTTGTMKTITLDFTIPGEPTPTSVAGVESRWVRCRAAPNDLPFGLFAATVDNPAFRAGPGSSEQDSFAPDRLLFGGIPLSVEAGVSFLPLGPTPSPQDAFYVASDEAFSKRGEQLTLWFRDTADDDGERRGIDGETPVLSWEYWDGVGWARLHGVTDDTAALTIEGTVTFTVPADLAPTSVAGRDGHWIRARLVDGQYVRTTYSQSDGVVQTSTEGSPPRYGTVGISYRARAPVAHVVTYNGLEYGDVVAGDAGPIEPFTAVAEFSQTLYLGFDGPLAGGPLSVLFDLGTREYAPGFDPRLRWERCVAPDRDDWVAVDATDRTDGLTGRGIVTMTFAEPTVPSRRFGRERHWLRARLTRDAFAAADDPLIVRRTDDARRAAGRPRTGAGDGRENRFVAPIRPGERLVARDRTATRSTTAPALRGVHPNTGWALDARRVERELLGSSDGSANQRLSVGNPPVLELSVWVDESTALSAGARADLVADRPDDVDVVTGPDGTVRECWVRWAGVQSFHGSTAGDRHYTLDPVAGDVAFGDGVTGRIPPRGRENVRATYWTGGGSVGNVPPGAVTGLTSAIPLVESVTNHVAADGGADEEPTTRVLTRARGTLRDRDRAVTATDFERVARASSPRVTRAKCLPGVDRSGEQTPGWVTLVVVPDSPDAKPTPSRELRRQVLDAMRAHAPASLVVPGRERLVVRGPNFIEVSVETTVVSTDVASLSTFEQLVTDRITAFLHPLTGGPGGSGWWFGELPSLSELYATLEVIEGVDHVERLSVTYHGSERDVTVDEGEPLPTVAPDVLACGGSHDVTVVTSAAEATEPGAGGR